MHDIKQIRKFPEIFDASMTKRGLCNVAQNIIELDEKNRSLINLLQEKQKQRNSVSEKIANLKRTNCDSSNEEANAISIRNEISDLELQSTAVSEELKVLLSGLPNVLADDVPVGLSEADNEEVKKVGVKPKFDFEPKLHHDIAERLGLLDVKTAVKIAGSRFSILKGDLAKLERALAMFMIDSHVQDYGYTEYSVPILVNSNAAFGTAQLPKFKDDLFQTTDGRWLISTAEISLTNTVREMILSESELPLRITACTPCFRSEAGATGKDTTGLIRQHQFYKVELVSITTPEASYAELERLLSAAESILQKLDLHYRVVNLCSGDIGSSSAKTYDIEVWLPGAGQYREISSCSNCLDYQARRMNTRFKDNNGNNTFVHTLNGSGLAIGRTIVAILENYQTKHGTVTIPKRLVKYMGVEEITNVEISS